MQSIPTDCYSRYDEAMGSFIEFVNDELQKATEHQQAICLEKYAGECS
jgi:hypothetical protein